MQLHIHNGPFVAPTSRQTVERDAEKDHGPRDERAIVHVGRTERQRRGPKAEEGQHDQVDAGADVDGDAESARDPPGAPRVRVRGVGVAVRDVASEAATEQEGARDQVGGVEALQDEGDDVVEGGGAADVDHAQESGEARHDHDGDQGDRGPSADLYPPKKKEKKV